MLDLEAGVGLDEGEGLAAVAIGGVDEEFEGAEGGVADAAGEAEGGFDDLGAEDFGEVGGGGDLDDLLEAALDAALALAEVGDGAVLVAEDLDLDVAGAGDELLDVDGAVAEGAEGLGCAAFIGGFEIIEGGDGAGASAAAASDRFDHHGAALTIGGTEGFEEGAGLFEGDGGVDASEGGDVGGGGGGAGAGFVAEEFEHFDGGADEGDAGFGAGAGEGGVLGEEAVAGVDGVGAGGLCGFDDGFDVEVGGDSPALEGDGFVGDAGVEGGGVVFGVDGDGVEAEVCGGSDDADGDFTPVGDEEVGEGHGRVPRFDAASQLGG